MHHTKIIERTPAGSIVFAGTDTPIESLIEHFVNDDSMMRFVNAHPSVKPEQILGLLHQGFRAFANNELSPE
jgi:hypothetical protein